MLRQIRFYLALVRAFFGRNKRLATYGFIALLLLVFVFRILLPSVYPKISEAAREFRKPSFVEGVVGTPAHPNPIFDTTETQKDISKLVYRGLMKVGENGVLEPDLSESLRRVSDTEYIVSLKQNVYWHDGEEFTADDVLHTFQTAQDPQFDSPISSSFKDVVVEKIDDYTVRFVLGEPFAPFPFAITIGIIPQHIPLKNFKPIGTGKFRVKQIDSEKIVVSSEKLNIVFLFYKTIEEAKFALKLGQIHALGGVSPQEAADFEMFGGKNVYATSLAFRQVIVFFNVRTENLREKDFRQALTYLINKKDLLSTIGEEGAEISTSQLPLKNWVGKQPEMYQANTKKAEENMKKLGLKREGEVWKNKGTPIELTITSVDDPELNSIVNFLQDSWNKFGISTKTNIINVETLRDDLLPKRNFEVLVDFQKISPDPDQYVLWHTTQVNNSNITGIKSAKLDKTLEDARRITDQAKRKDKYILFTKLLLDEAPAIFLYYPQYYWVVSDKVEWIDLSDFAEPGDRFNSSGSWVIKRKFL